MKMMADIQRLQDKVTELERAIEVLKAPFEKRVADFVEAKLDATVLKVVKAAFKNG